MEEDMGFCPNCGAVGSVPSAYGGYTAAPPPVYAVPPQYPQGAYPAPAYPPYAGPFYYPPTPQRTAAGGGCTLMILDGALAIPIWFILLASWVPVPGLLLMLGSIIAIVGGALALKGVTPVLALAGPPLLIVGAISMFIFSVFLALVAIIGLVLAAISMGLVLYGWSDLRERARLREQALKGMYRR